jgi:hypothetical protein
VPRSANASVGSANLLEESVLAYDSLN